MGEVEWMEGDFEIIGYERSLSLCFAEAVSRATVTQQVIVRRIAKRLVILVFAQLHAAAQTFRDTILLHSPCL